MNVQETWYFPRPQTGRMFQPFPIMTSITKPMKTALFSLFFVLAAAPIALAQSPPATAAPDTAVHLVTYLDLIPNKAAAERPLLVQQTMVARGQPGCRMSELLQEQGLPNHFMLVETWDDVAALESYRATEGYRAFRATLQPAIGSPLDERRAKQITPVAIGSASK